MLIVKAYFEGELIYDPLQYYETYWSFVCHQKHYSKRSRSIWKLYFMLSQQYYRIVTGKMGLLSHFLLSAAVTQMTKESYWFRIKWTEKYWLWSFIMLTFQIGFIYKSWCCLISSSTSENGCSSNMIRKSYDCDNIGLTKADDAFIDSEMLIHIYLSQKIWQVIRSIDFQQVRKVKMATTLVFWLVKSGLVKGNLW